MADYLLNLCAGQIFSSKSEKDVICIESNKNASHFLPVSSHSF